jgi:hypothetical protein
MDSQTTVEDEADMEHVDANIKELWESATLTWKNVAKNINESWDLSLNGNSTRLRYNRYEAKLRSERRGDRKRHQKGVSTKSDVDEVEVLHTQSVHKRMKTERKDHMNASSLGIHLPKAKKMMICSDHRQLR